MPQKADGDYVDQIIRQAFRVIPARPWIVMNHRPTNFADDDWHGVEEHLDLNFVYGVAGIDDAGIACYAGPYAAAAVRLDYVKLEKHPAKYMVVDCKRLDDEQLKIAYTWIVNELAIAIGYAEVWPKTIDRLGPRLAHQKVMRDAATNLLTAGHGGQPFPIGMFLVDYYFIQGLPYPQWAVAHGDELFYCVSAASIVAKYRRDSRMRDLSIVYPEYGWDRNKGCIGPAARKAICQHGLCPIHRRAYLTRFAKKIPNYPKFTIIRTGGKRW